MNIDFKIDGTLDGTPVEYRGIELELNFENPDKVSASITADKFTFVNDQADYLNAFVDAGLTGGLGIFWGPNFEVKVDEYSVFDGHIDLTEDAEFSCEKVIAKINEKKKLDWIEKKADAFGFDFLYYNGTLTINDFVNIPYILSEIPNYREAALLTFSGIMIGIELVRAVKDVVNIVGDFSGIFNAGGGAIKLIFYIVYIIILLIALYKLIKDIISQLMQPIKYHKGMFVKTLFEKAFQYLGMTFNSSIFDPNVATNNELSSGMWELLAILPEKYQAGAKKNQGNLQMGYPEGTFGDFIRGMEAVFNAKLIIIGTVAHFERRDYGASNSVYQIPDLRRRFHGYNTQDIVSNYLVQFQIDNQDTNTIQNYNGTNAKNYTKSVVSDSTKTELLKGFRQPNIPYALGKRKDDLNFIEKVVKEILNVMDLAVKPIFIAINVIVNILTAFINSLNKVIDALNNLPGVSLNKIPAPAFNQNQVNTTVIIDNRIGSLLLSTEMVGVPKLLILSDKTTYPKINVTNKTQLTAEQLWKWYHYLESFVPSVNNPTGNQAFQYDIATIPFCLEDLYKIRGINNENEGPAKILSPEGDPARILSIKWNIWKNKASIRYYRYKAYTYNLAEQLIINFGI